MTMVAVVAGAVAVTIAGGGPVGASAGQSVTDITGELTAAALAQSLVGDGVAVSNVTYAGDNRAAGRFTGFGSATGINSGVVLSSGAVATDGEGTGGSIAGPNTSDSVTANFGTPGDADLTAIAGVETHDASVLEFDFVPSGSQISFDYVFGSEEYDEFVGQFNDAFGFFVNGANCATIGSSSEPVSISNINKSKNATLYRPNDLSDGSPTIDTQMDGLSTVLTCTAPVNQGVVNHLKLAVADASDTAYDTSVLLKAGSLSAPATKQPSVDKSVVGYKGTPSVNVTTNSAATSNPGELLVAYVQADGPADKKQSVKSVTGGGLTWTRAAATNLTGLGANEVWTAYAVNPKSAFAVMATFTLSANSALTVVSYKDAQQTLGATQVSTGSSGPAASTVTPTVSKSLIGASGLDWTSATKPVPVSGQSLTTFIADKTATNYYWSQSVAAPTTAGSPVTVQATIPSADRWSLIAVEIKASAP